MHPAIETIRDRLKRLDVFLCQHKSLKKEEEKKVFEKIIWSYVNCVKESVEILAEDVEFEIKCTK